MGHPVFGNNFWVFEYYLETTTTNGPKTDYEQYSTQIPNDQTI